MKHLAALLFLWAGPALADCPDPTLNAPTHRATGPELIAPQSWDVRAEGGNLAPCGTWVVNGLGDDLDGFLPVAATATFDLDAMGPHILMVMAQAECGAVLAVREGQGLWYFGREANGRQEVTLWGTGNGPLQVWVGSVELGGCDATLILETFDR